MPRLSTFQHQDIVIDTKYSYIQPISSAQNKFLHYNTAALQVLGHYIGSYKLGDNNMFGLGKKKDFTATILNTGQTFEVNGGINLLQAALNAGIEWPHDCRVGSCGSCRATIKSGKIKPLNDFSYVLDGEQLKNGMVLACQSRLTSDIEVEVDFEQGSIN